MRYIFLISLVVLTACGKNEFTLEFRLASDITDNYNVTYYATDKQGGKTIQAVASVREGKCVLDGITKKPTLIYVTTRSSALPLVMYGEKEDKLEITGENKDPLYWRVEGNEINAALSEWRMRNDSIWLECNADSVNSAVKKYVEENPENPASTILMLCYYNRSVNEREYNDLMATLKGEAKNPDWLKIIGRTDQVLHTYSYPARLESISLRSTNKEGDTLFIDKKNPVLILFWELGYANRKDMIDSIKVLEKEFPDSARIIADVCLDIDSTGWRNAIRKDSLYEDMKRFWAPAGMNQSKIMKLKVDGIPYFIVFNKEGEQSYRGNSISEALKEYRQLFNSSDSSQN